MYKNHAILYLQNISPLHAGAGSQIGIVDLPIQREIHTGYPKIESSSLKGALRQRLENTLSEQEPQRKTDLLKLNLAFGYDENGVAKEIKNEFDGSTGKFDKFFQGALSFSDARILFFPVKSMKGVMAWVTCPMVLNRFAEDLKIITNPKKDDEFIASVEALGKSNISDSECIISNDCNVKIVKDTQNYVILEEYAFKANDDARIEVFCEKVANGITNLVQHLVILSNDDFVDFVQLSTEINTRIKIDDVKGTVADGQLFTEEFLPCETVLYSIIGASPVFQTKNKTGYLDKAPEVLAFFKTALKNARNVFQLGGNSSLGKGIIHATII
jgi:CRISPR-associated protein Cmr4